MQIQAALDPVVQLWCGCKLSAQVDRLSPCLWLLECSDNRQARHTDSGGCSSALLSACWNKIRKPMKSLGKVSLTYSKRYPSICFQAQLFQFIFMVTQWFAQLCRYLACRKRRNISTLTPQGKCYGLLLKRLSYSGLGWYSLYIISYTELGFMEEWPERGQS